MNICSTFSPEYCFLRDGVTCRAQQRVGHRKRPQSGQFGFQRGQMSLKLWQEINKHHLFWDEEIFERCKYISVSLQYSVSRNADFYKQLTDRTVELPLFLFPLFIWSAANFKKDSWHGSLIFECFKKQTNSSWSRSSDESGSELGITSTSSLIWLKETLNLECDETFFYQNFKYLQFVNEQLNDDWNN